MIYDTARDWLETRHRRVALFGMSGLGKTHVSNNLRAGGGWFHYSVDYRIGTRYLGEEIHDNLKFEAMKNPYLAALLRSDSIDVSARLRFDNLAPLSAWLGKPGNPKVGGLAIADYRRRQALHRNAEISATLDCGRFIDRAQTLYGYDHFVCDTSGSFCEVVDPEDARDPLLTTLAKSVLLVWIRGNEAHNKELVRRFESAPKPMYYQPDFLDHVWEEYLHETGQLPDAVNPDDFVRYAYAQALTQRQPRYRAIAEHWGVAVAAQDIAAVRDEDDFAEVIAAALTRPDV